MAQMSFSTQGIDTTNPYEALPKGEYTVIVTDSELKVNRQGTGQILALSLQVQAPEHFRGRSLWANLNINHPNQTAQRIAEQHLAQLCTACGLQAINDTNQLHGIPVTAIVTIQKDDPTRNEVKGFKAVGSPQPHLQAVQTPAQQPQQQAMAQPATQHATPAPQAEAQPAAQQPPQPTAQPAQPAMAVPPWLQNQK